MIFFFCKKLIFFNFNFFYFYGQSGGNNEDGQDYEIVDEETSSPLLHQLETDLLKLRMDGDQGSVGDHSFSQPSSLFGEIHLSEIKKLEKNLEQVENEKNAISNKLYEIQSQATQASQDLATHKATVEQAMIRMRQSIVSQISIDDDKPPNETSEDIEEQVNDIIELIRRLLDTSTTGQLQNQLIDLRRQLESKESVWKEQEGDLQTLSKLAEETQSALCSTQDDLTFVTEELAAIYYQLCDANGETPSRILLEHAASKPDVRMAKLEELRHRLSATNSSNLLQNWRSVSSENGPKDSVEILKEQLKHLKSTVQVMLECRSARVQPPSVAAAVSGANKIALSSGIGPSPSLQAISEHVPIDGDSLKEQNMRYKALISTKREQVATLRTVLKANKQTAEVALANLKSRYETEKQLVSETMSRLRTELKALKEDAATFASLRSMFAARCEEYVAQNDELQRQLQSCEEEKKTLNSLLRIAIQQKLGLTQKMEEYEMDRERMYSGAAGGASGTGSGPTGGVTGPQSNQGPGSMGNKNGLLRGRGGRSIGGNGNGHMIPNTGNGGANAFVRSLSRIGPLSNSTAMNRGMANQMMQHNSSNNPSLMSKRNHN